MMMKKESKNTAEQWFVCLPIKARVLKPGKVLADFLDCLEYDMGEPLDKNFNEKETCLEILKHFLRDRILEAEKYKYLADKAYDFYDIFLPCFCAEPAEQIVKNIWDY